MSRLEGKIALVTGASSGIGRAIALELARSGAAAVVVADLSDGPREGGRSTTALIAESSDAEALFVHCDVSDSAQVTAAVGAAESLGGLDVLVNNAGIVGPGSRLTEIDDDAIDAVLRVNICGTLYGCRAAARVMTPRGSGSIVNVSSVVALGGSSRTSVYAASKGAVAAASYALSAELGPRGIRVNAVHPGMIQTAMTTQDQQLAAGTVGETLSVRVPLRRTGTPDDVAKAVAFLAGDDSGYVTGTSAVVDGGWSRAL
ncbi:glucose 1-dehydrogenase [Rhodococcus sp. 14-2483-1-2]|uniref:SDR family NAD(P)-dependent oxidoreductase n=1 Tax=Rhodococcus sp. 14-2483-1-2 TaxID=2023147 RepID=UPI000B9B513F|nr:glucose 1-dehydrogenase [Rhodococcus sp. 14-2483-1-2]OZF39568.1 hypothetical protein CH295_02320 [Rhodococcus sp. 14-2483-1-2]